MQLSTVVSYIFLFYDKNGNISNNVEDVSITGYVFGRTYIFTYVIDEIVKDCGVTVTVGTATV